MQAVKEADVVAIAKKMADLSSTNSSGVYSMSFWNEKLLGWAMARPSFKERLFRFVDVFPSTTNNKDILHHIREYLDVDGVPTPLRNAIKTAGVVPFGATVAASQAKSNIGRMAQQFILGSTPAEAVKEARKLWDEGKTVTVDLLGEKTVAESEADAYGERVMELLDALGAAAPTWPKRDHEPVHRISISIKPTALASRYHPLTRKDGLAQASARIRPILRKAQSVGALVWFDMEHYDVKDITIDLYKQLLGEEEFSALEAGLVMQAYLRDTYKDLEAVIAWAKKRHTRISVRLVKGAYWDTETIYAQTNDWPIPVFQNKYESDASYERCTRLLIDNNRTVRCAFASHNLRSLAYAIACARANKLGPNDYEIQMLYGMAEPMHEAVAKMGLPLRVYAPVGEMVPGMAYLVRRLLENTSNESFVRLRYAERKELDSLLGAPKAADITDALPRSQRSATDALAPKPYLPEPLAEWHHSDARTAMQSALDSLDRELTRGKDPVAVPGIINGRKVYTNATIDSVDPANPKIIVARSASCRADAVDAAVAGATKAQREWAARSASERAQVLFDAAHWMRTRRFELNALQVREAGKPWADADGDVCEAIDFCEYYGREALRLDKGAHVQSTPGETNRLGYQARGVGVVISPWNFPLAIPTGMVTAALVTGNAVLFKPAEQTPLIAQQLVNALKDSGLPDGVLQFLPGLGEDVGAAMVAHPQTTFIAFTGSKPVGLSIMEQAAKIEPGQRNIKRAIIELGGKNPAIVDSDADLDQVVPAVIYSAFGFGGQKCSALSRLIVLESVHDALVERLVGAVNALKVGAPTEMSVDVGPVIDQEAQQRIRGVVASGSGYGTVAVTRSDVPTDGYFVGPTIVTGVDPASPLAKDEIFGPVLSVLKARDLDHALELANDTDYALTAGIFSRTPSHIQRLSTAIRAGNVYVNRTTTGAVVGRQPFGGWGLSGGGTKAGGPDYLLNFTEPRVITENTIRQGFASSEVN